MPAAVIARLSGRGRQSANVETLRDLRDELRAERLEGAVFARRALGLSTRLESAGRELGSPSILQAGLELGYHASRFLRQRPEGSR